MKVTNAIRLCGFNLNRTLTKTINLFWCQADCLRCRINNGDVTHDDRVIDLIIQIRKIGNRTLISAIVDVEEAGDTISGIVNIIAVQKRLKCRNLRGNGHAAGIVGTILQVHRRIRIQAHKETVKITLGRYNATFSHFTQGFKVS